jgi:hypothetical protein
MTNDELNYSVAFAKYLQKKGPPRAEDVPPIPVGMSEDRARDIRWIVYEQVKKIGQNLC